MDAAVVVPTLTSLLHFSLYHLKYVRVNDGFVVILNIVLGNLALVGLFLFGQVINGVGLLQKRITLVLLAAQNTFRWLDIQILHRP
jgi:hypothetical protein